MSGSSLLQDDSNTYNTIYNNYPFTAKFEGKKWVENFISGLIGSNWRFTRANPNFLTPA